MDPPLVDLKPVIPPGIGIVWDLPSNRGGRVLRPSFVSTMQYPRRWHQVHEPSLVAPLSFAAALGGVPDACASVPRAMGNGWSSNYSP
jgi:hypothetical protein